MGQSRVRHDLDGAGKRRGAERSPKLVLGQEVTAAIYRTGRGRKHTALQSL